MKLTFNKKTNTLIIEMKGNKVYSDNPTMFEFSSEAQKQLEDAGVNIVVQNGHFVSNVSGDLMSFSNFYAQGKGRRVLKRIFKRWGGR